MKATLERLLAREDLSEAEAGELLGVLADDGVPDAAKAALLVALRMKGETPHEVRGLARAMLARGVGVARPEGIVVDTCGTGGDGSGTVNLSTAAALVLAALGVRVAKHGNRSVSSKSGSVDLVEAFGLPVVADPLEAGALLRDQGFVFLFAPHFHPATRGVAAVRRQVGIRTVFNVLGPLVNPARPSHQLVGAFSPEAGRLLARTLSGMGLERAAVVHGDPGWDEATPVGPFLLLEVRPGEVTERVVDPADLGLPRCRPEDLAGGTGADNAALLRRVFEGAQGPMADAVALNVALVLELTGQPINAALSRAQEALQSGLVARWLDGQVRR